MRKKLKQYDSCAEHRGLIGQEEQSSKFEWYCRRCKKWFWGPGGKVGL